MNETESETETYEDQAVPLSGAVEEENLPEGEPVTEKAKSEGRHTVLQHERIKREAVTRKWNQAPEGGGKYALSPDGRRVRV